MSIVIEQGKEKTKLIKKYLQEYPNLANKTLATKIYKENNLMFDSAESVRDSIRYYRGARGASKLKAVTDIAYLDESKRAEKYNLPEPIKTLYEPYRIVCASALIFGDVHIPFYERQAVESMFDFTADKKPEVVIIDGDLMDMYDISFFNKIPDLVTIKDEIEQTKQFLRELKRVYPGSRIYYKYGNHEKRLDAYIRQKAPELYGVENLQLNVLLDLFNIGITHIEDNKYIIMNAGLKIIHGHEYGSGFINPVNQARTTFLKTFSTVISAHGHRTSQHQESNIDGEIISNWSIGCLCGLNPEYRPLNRWNHGFAFYKKDDEKYWHVSNHTIIDGRVV